MLTLSGPGYLPPSTLIEVAFALVMTLILNMVIAGAYIWTFRGMSYTRSFVLTLLVGGSVASTVMMAINGNLAAGIGIAGSLAFVRFRTSMRDPRDMVFVFATMSAGLACGIGAYPAAVLGAALFSISTVAFTYLELGATQKFEALLRFRSSSTPDAEKFILRILRQYCRHFSLVTLRELSQGDEFEHAYQIQLRHPSERIPLVQALDDVQGTADVSVHFQDATVEL